MTNYWYQAESEGEITITLKYKLDMTLIAAGIFRVQVQIQQNLCCYES